MLNTSLKTLYKTKICPELLNKFHYSNIHEIPKLTKITINRGLGEAAQNSKALDSSITVSYTHLTLPTICSV